MAGEKDPNVPENKQQSSQARKSGARAEETSPGRRVRLDTSRMTTAYCNFFSAQQGPEEVVLNFGLRQQWDADDQNLNVSILQQVILHPAAVRRLRDLLDKVMADRAARAAQAKPAA